MWFLIDDDIFFLWPVVSFKNLTGQLSLDKFKELILLLLCLLCCERDQKSIVKW